jgi:hypothetical protein
MQVSMVTSTYTSVCPCHTPERQGLTAFYRLLRAYLPEDVIQRRILTFIPSRPRTSDPSHFSSLLTKFKEECSWHPLQECKKELDRARYACFAHPEHSSQVPAPLRGQRSRSWRDLFSSLGFSATVPEVPLEVLESLKILVNEDNEPRIGSFTVRFSYPHHLRRPGLPRKLQDRRWSDKAKVKETLSALVHSLGFDLAKRLVYRIQEWSLV